MRSTREMEGNMRPIKFRAWDKLYSQMRDVTMFSRFHVYYYNKEEAAEYSAPLSQFDLMQFTGLLDKNGKEIWEGDIVKFKIPLPKEKINSEELPRGTVINFGPCFEIDCQTFMFTLTTDVEVIGNIYENPELIKG